MLGQGAFGKVLLARYLGKQYALKVLYKSHVLKMGVQDHVKREARLLMECKNDFIVNMVATGKSEDKLYMLMEPVLGGELFTYLRVRARMGISAVLPCLPAVSAFIARDGQAMFRVSFPVIDVLSTPAPHRNAGSLCKKTRLGSTLLASSRPWSISRPITLLTGKSLPVVVTRRVCNSAPCATRAQTNSSD